MIHLFSFPSGPFFFSRPDLAHPHLFVTRRKLHPFSIPRVSSEASPGPSLDPLPFRLPLSIVASVLTPPVFVTDPRLSFLPRSFSPLFFNRIRDLHAPLPFCRPPLTQDRAVAVMYSLLELYRSLSLYQTLYQPSPSTDQFWTPTHDQRSPVPTSAGKKNPPKLWPASRPPVSAPG